MRATSTAWRPAGRDPRPPGKPGCEPAQPASSASATVNPERAPVVLTQKWHFNGTRSSRARRLGGLPQPPGARGAASRRINAARLPVVFTSNTFLLNKHQYFSGFRRPPAPRSSRPRPPSWKPPSPGRGVPSHRALTLTLFFACLCDDTGPPRVLQGHLASRSAD